MIDQAWGFITAHPIALGIGAFFVFGSIWFFRFLRREVPYWFEGPYN